ncbi:Fasciclin-2 [Hypsibius exemplaris]|uniref:Fasciclin-2 n=1 Tax=Hypsibius exemplaris TaxID=2072580 RepID=A0A1W0WDT2_HYPEX|nr:Fasciclin-2 [Hypsibius exemplaris]
MSRMLPNLISSMWTIALVAQATDDGVKLAISPQGPLNKASGENVYLRCALVPELAKTAVTDIRWQDPRGDLISGSTREGDRIYSQTSDTASTQLFIMKLQKEDAGDYVCYANFPGHEQLRSTITIDVYQDIEFVDAPAVQNPVSGELGKITCEVSGNPAPQVDWLRDGTELDTSGGRYKVDTDGLYITGINVEDDGEYTCRAVVAANGGLKSQKIKVEVHNKPEFTVDEEPQNVRGIEQKTVAMKCGVTGRPVPEITWVFLQSNSEDNGKDVTKIEDEQRTSHHTVDPVTGTMTINDLQKRHQGDYKCIAKNPAGIIEKIASLFVAEIPRFDIVSNTTESEGGSATLQCTARGDPAPTLQYTKEGQLQSFVAGADPRITVREKERELTLTINQLTREDDGLYVCVASNEAGTAEKSSHVTVKFKPSFQNTPMHVAKTWLDNKIAVNLTCIAESIPNATIRWEKKQRNEMHGAPFLLITENSPNIVIEQRGPSSSLLISPKTIDDFGVFECIAANEMGEARHIITLYEATAPGPITLVEFAEITANSIRFNIDGPNEPNNLDLDSYEVYYHEAGDSMDTAIKRLWPIGTPYTLENLKPRHSYFFRFYAKNAVGLSINSRDFERTMPDVGPPRPPGYIPPTNESIDANRYRLQWTEAEDNGARILDYQVKYWKDGEKDKFRVVTVPAPASHTILSGLSPSTRYYYELTARNERGIGPAMNNTFTTAHAQSVHRMVDPSDYGLLMSTPVIIGIAIGSLLLLLLLLDVCCYCGWKRGVIAFICLRICGQSKNLKEEDAEKRTIDETDLHYEKQPLTTTVTETTLKTTYREAAAELEPEDKPSP